MLKHYKIYSVILVSLSSLLSAAISAQGLADTQAVGEVKPALKSTVEANFDQALTQKNKWYFSWGYSRQQYAPSDIHVSQPGLGNDFTVHQVKASDFPTDLQGTIDSIVSLDVTGPQENIRVGKFMNPEENFALEFSLDHSKYNTDIGQSAKVTGTIDHKSVDTQMVLSDRDFRYNLHNGLNHLMVNAVWFKHLAGPEKKPGDLQLLSRLGAGILLPHADNTILGKDNQVGPKGENVCCFASNDWWQVNGWTIGTEVGVRYTIYKSIFLELTAKLAYGELRNVPVYQGTASQNIWMAEQVLSTGFVF